MRRHLGGQRDVRVADGRVFGLQHLVHHGGEIHHGQDRSRLFRAPEGDYETIGGLVLEKLGHIPEEGESVELTAFDPDGMVEDPIRWRATVVTMDGRRIDTLRLTELGRGGEHQDG